jgi:hypothetical protein
MKMNYKITKDFFNEYKKLFKKYKSLETDLENFKNRFPGIDLTANKNFAILKREKNLIIFKARFFCKSLKGQTLRLIGVYYHEDGLVEFIEIYFKGNKENEDRERIREYLKNFK